MGGIILDQPLPNASIEQVDPFLLIHHWNDVLPGNQNPKDVGVGPHPHRGFAPVSVIFKGNLHHRDSHGYNSIVKEGGTQWMNSGKGIIHSERPSAELVENGGPLEFIQFWINAPAKNKMDTPKYQALTKEDTPWIATQDGKGTIGLIAGELFDQKSPIDSYTDTLILRIEMKKGGQESIPINPSFNSLIYLLNGSVLINGVTEIHSKDFILFGNDGEGINLQATADSRMLLLSGEPINEELSTYGPFVMNNQKELMEAIRDYQAGKMGYLVEEF
jgi:redox-sensitive bicupin YhaK (pirin superfamily)